MVAAALVVSACSGVPSSVPDMGVAPGPRALEALSPGPEIGARPGDQIDLRVAYLGPDREPIAAARVRFAIFGDPRGSTLSADQATTGETGVAAVTLSVGAAATEYEFRVRASVDEAAVDFFVAVSREGFASLAARLAYRGLQLGDPDALEVTMHPDRACESIDARDPPEGERSKRISSLDQAARFENLLTRQRYAVLATGRGGEGLPIAGCVPLAPERLRVGIEAGVTVPLADLASDVAGRFDAESALDLARLGGLEDALAALADLGDCPLDPAQRLLDAVVQALDAETAAALTAPRGARDEEGCRPVDTGLDRELADLLARSDEAASVVEALGGVGGRAAALASTLTIDSVLWVGADLSATHRVESVRFSVGDRTAAFAPAGLPVIESPLRIERRLDSLALGAHAFTLRTGSVFAQAVSDLALRGVDAHAPASALVRGTGCETIDARLCEGAGLQDGCALAACVAAVETIDAAVAAGFATLDGEGLDFALAGQAHAADVDGDGVADAFRDGVWSATVADLETPVDGTFQARRSDE